MCIALFLTLWFFVGIVDSISTTPDPRPQTLLTFTSDGVARVAGSLLSTSGTSTLHDLEVRKGIKVHGELSARSITAIKSNATRFEAESITAESITTNKAVVNVLNVTSDASLKGKIFIDTLYSRRQIEAKDLSTSKLTVNDQASFQGKADFADVTVKKIQIQESEVKNIVADLVDAKRIQVQNIAVGGKMETERIVLRPIKAKDKRGFPIANSNAADAGRLDAVEIISKSATSDDMIVRKMTQTKDLSATGTAEVKFMNVEKLDVTGPRGVTVTNGPLTVAQKINANSDIAVNGTMTSIKLDARNATVSNTLTVKHISSGIIISKEAQVKEMVIENINIEESLVADSITAKSISTNGILESASIIADKMIVNGVLEAKSAVNCTHTIYSSDSIVAGKDLRSEGGLFIASNASIDGSIISKRVIRAPLLESTDLKCKSAIVNGTLISTSVQINETLKSPRAVLGFGDMGWEKGHGSLIVDSTSVNVQSELIGGNATFQHITMRNATVSILAAEDIHVQEMVANTSIIKGSLKSMAISVNGTAAITGDVRSNGTISAPVLDGSILNTVNITGQHATIQTVEVTNLTSRDTLRSEYIYGASMEVSDGVKARSFIGKRMYTEDLAASGIITAHTLFTKGDSKLNGNVHILGETSIESKLTSEDLSVTNNLECTTATFRGSINAAGMEIRKLNVNGEFKLNNIDLFEKIKQLEEAMEKIKVLEKMVQDLQEVS